MKPIRIATRGSQLALTQASMVANVLGRPSEIKIIKTTGDIRSEEPLKKLGGKEVFTKELDEALLNDAADIAVHSLKDVPGILHPELEITAVLPRADARDVLIGADSFDAIPQGATFGTSSPRRMAQVLHVRPDLKCIEFRGNVETRLKKIKDGVAAASLLAAAGLERLNIISLLENGGDAVSKWRYIPVAEMTPAVGQGIICIVTRRGAFDLSHLNHAASFTAMTAERAVLKAFGGSCYTPLAAHAIITDRISLTGFVASDDYRRTFQTTVEGNISDAEKLGCELGKELLYKHNDLNNAPD